MTTTHNIATVRWLDTRAVQLVSNYLCTEPMDKCRRWNGVSKKFEDIPRPAIIAQYNKFMGGVDLADMLLELYRIDHKSTKYYTRIVYWCIGTAVVNSWLLYRRHMSRIRPTSKTLSLIEFQASVAKGLIDRSKSVQVPLKRGRPSKTNEPTTSSENSPGESVKYSITPTPDKVLRTDGLNHWVQWEGRGRCRSSKTAFPTSKCSKCGVYLCCNPKNNCFFNFHM